jgi:hypothetical protein
MGEEGEKGGRDEGKSLLSPINHPFLLPPFLPSSKIYSLIHSFTHSKFTH